MLGEANSLRWENKNAFMNPVTEIWCIQGSENVDCCGEMPYSLVSVTSFSEKHTAFMFSPEDGNVGIYLQSTRRYDPEDQHRELHRPENLISHRDALFSLRQELNF
jgi:hypothetical protein